MAQIHMSILQFSAHPSVQCSSVAVQSEVGSQKSWFTDGGAVLKKQNKKGC